MAVTLAVTDNGDGTAAATVGGAAGAWTLYRRAWTGRAGGVAAWVESGSGAAPGGTVPAVACGYGFHVWLAVDSTAALSPLVYRPTLDPADAVHVRCLDAVVQGIRDLNLDGFADDEQIFRRWFPKYIPGTDDAASETPEPGAGLPQIQVSPFGREVPLGRLTGLDDVGYPVLVAFFDSSNGTRDYELPRHLKWRQKVAARFRAQPLGVPGVFFCDWQPDATVTPSGLENGYTVGAMVLLFRSREARGLIA